MPLIVGPEHETQKPQNSDSIITPHEPGEGLHRIAVHIVDLTTGQTVWTVETDRSNLKKVSVQTRHRTDQYLPEHDQKKF